MLLWLLFCYAFVWSKITLVLVKTYRNNGKNFYNNKRHFHESVGSIQLANIKPEIKEEYNLKNPKVKCFFCKMWKHIYFVDPHDYGTRHNVVLIIESFKRIFSCEYPFVCWKCFAAVNKFLYIKVMEFAHEGRLDDIYEIVRNKYNVPEGREEDFLAVFAL